MPKRPFIGVAKRSRIRIKPGRRSITVRLPFSQRTSNITDITVPSIKHKTILLKRREVLKAFNKLGSILNAAPNVRFVRWRRRIRRRRIGGCKVDNHRIVDGRINIHRIAGCKVDRDSIDTANLNVVHITVSKIMKAQQLVEVANEFIRLRVDDNTI